MAEPDDHELLAEFARGESEAAFSTLAARYVDLVYSTARRFSGNPHHAEEITQAVFIILARKAGRLNRSIILSGWLYQAARLTAANFVKAEIRRQEREQEAYMQSTLNDPSAAAWEQIAPLLDEAMGALGDTDRNTVVLRYFQNKTAAEAAAALKMSEAATHKRTNRALEKLRVFFAKRGLTLSAALIAGAVSGSSVQAAPPGLAVVIGTSAAQGTAISATLTTLIKGTMKTMTWLKLKFAIGGGAIALLAGGGAIVALSQTDVGGKLTAQEIIQKSRDAYGALTSYADEGVTVSSVGATSVAPHVFSMKLAQPNLYRIEWTQGGFFTNGGVVWSAGEGDFQKTFSAPRPEKNKEEALTSAAGISGGASLSIPGLFFKVNSGNQLGGAMQRAVRQPDAKIGEQDCYVLTQATGGRTKTLWISKQDWLIRQIQNETSAAALKTQLESAAKLHPESPLPTIASGDVKSVETHSKIVVNQTHAKKDFEP